MTNAQERLQMNRALLDKWSAREKLCLASAVACSGDQNWMSVSRTLKILCGNTKDALQSRPADWFSQKNCAVQYGHLLEDVKTPKRKNRTSESSVSSPAALERTTEAILKRLEEERMQEIELELLREQAEYAKIIFEIKAIQGEQISDEDFIKMWKEIEKEQEMQRIEEMKFENLLRERELKKQELQRSWRTGTNTHSSSSSTNSLKSSTDTTTIDMDVEEIIGSGKTIIQSSHNNTTAGQIQTGTSPLLSSLLKSPTAGTQTTIIASTPSVRNTAPTITTLLTGGSIQNQPALIPSHDEAVQMLTRPISGPPLDTIPTLASVTQTLLSPSQSAPTLSLLLEKNKSGNQIPVEAINNDSKIIENSSLNDSNNESVPMDIEEDLTSTKIETNTNEQTSDIDDADVISSNEEQQLLEVFKSIGNIEGLDIDVSDVINEEVDFLKGVDEETPLDENIDLEQKLDNNISNLTEDIKLLSSETSDPKTDKAYKDKSTDNELESASNKVEVISSDDSYDNLPLAAVASMESSKDRSNMNESSNEDHFLKDQVESAILKNELDSVETVDETISNNSVKIKQEMLDEHEKFNMETGESDDIAIKTQQQWENSLPKDDVFVAPLTEDSKQEATLKREREDRKEDKQQEEKFIKIELKEEQEINVDSKSLTDTESNDQLSSNSITTDSQQEANEILTLPKIQPPPSISIADTDENSSSTDISVQTRKDEKHTSTNRGQRKSPHDTKTDDEMPNPSVQQMATPHLSSGNLTPRPTALRKLRERDRSESPMIDDDATTHSDHSTTNHRSRRRYSSTPVIDSIPNSPASSDRDDRELRTSKKFLLSIYNVLYASKYSGALQRTLNDENSAQKSNENICLKSIDFITIKKNIESGVTRSVHELQRDLLLMCQNALMITKTSSVNYKIILQFQQECQNIREFMGNGCDPGHKLEREARDTKSNSSTASSTGGGTSKGRSGSRKSLRLS